MAPINHNEILSRLTKTSCDRELLRNGAPYPVLASGTPLSDKDRDGMPDSWEIANGLNPTNAADGAKISANGYTNLENYINKLAGDIIP